SHGGATARATRPSPPDPTGSRRAREASRALRGARAAPASCDPDPTRSSLNCTGRCATGRPWRSTRALPRNRGYCLPSALFDDAVELVVHVRSERNRAARSSELAIARNGIGSLGGEG